MTKKIFILFIAVLLTAGAIFYFSSQDGPSSQKTSSGFVELALRLFVPDLESLPAAEQTAVRRSINIAVRKAAHVFEYTVFGALLMMLSMSVSARREELTGKRTGAWFTALISVSLGAMYAAADEIHQSYTGRTSRFTDVLIDCAGVIAGAAAAVIITRIIGKNARNKHADKIVSSKEQLPPII
ncbi:MAG: VanZ family protein [Clostridiales bacterium]|nr:VanZ family protein [Clostridiales bacterium]